MTALLLQAACCLLLQAFGPSAASLSPALVWPLGDTSGFAEVIKGHHATHPGQGDQCFSFETGPDDVPYRAIRLTGDESSLVEVNFQEGDFPFRDITLSLFVYPEDEPSGIIVSYVSDTGDNLKVFVTGGLMFVSFWDEYGVSVGVTALPDILQANTWNHLVIARQFSTGTIKIFNNGELQQELDDDFPNQIPLPPTGLLRLGGSADSEEENDERFQGRITCFQMYDAFPVDNDVSNFASFCLPGKWKVKPEVLFDQREEDGVVLSCQISLGKAGKPCDRVGLHCLTGGAAWRRLLAKNNWADSGRNAAYFRVLARGHLPEGDDHLLGAVNATGRRICSRLCMRVQGCQAFALDEAEAKAEVQCRLYDSVEVASRPEPSSSYFALRQ